MIESSVHADAMSGSARLFPAGWRHLPLYLLFALAVFVIHGMHPVLGADHVSYMQLADEILAKRPGGDYWRESNSVRSFGVLLAYLHALTGSHVLSMKLLLVVSTALYLLAAELFFSLFTTKRWHAAFFAILSAFAVSFGISSWGVTDSTALLPRSLVAPFVMVALWMWVRFRDRWIKYLTFSLLVVASLLHLSAFYVIGILCLVEAWDFGANRRFRMDWRVPAFAGGLLLAASLLFAFESAGISVRLFGGFIPKLFTATKFAAPSPQPVPPTVSSKPAPAAPGALKATTATAKDAWALELLVRPWRNMPLPPANVANMFSSFALILALALFGIHRARRAGFNDNDRLMAAMFVATPVFAFLPQTALWILRSFTNVYPATIEEVRAIGFIMVPALYFILRLWQTTVVERGENVPMKTAALAAAVLVLPLGLKSLPIPTREAILSMMIASGAVDGRNEGSVANARAALGILHTTPFYYSTVGTIDWLRKNSRPGDRILTDRDELVLLSDREVIGPRQVAGVPQQAVELPSMVEVFFRTQEALQSRSTARMHDLAVRFRADFYIVPWPVDGAEYRDQYFSVVKVGRR